MRSATGFFVAAANSGLLRVLRLNGDARRKLSALFGLLHPSTSQRLVQVDKGQTIGEYRLGELILARE